MLRADNILFSYNKTASFEYPGLFCDVDYPLLITGKSGSGKTTLLHLLGGILKPTGGNLNINSTDVSNLSNSELDRFRGKHIGIVYQRSHFMAALPVIDNILLSQYFSGNALSPEKAKGIADRLNIGHLLDKLPLRLSQGEQQRVSIARALLKAPKLILADEPTSSLDDDNCSQVIHLLKEQSAVAGSALVIVTHDGRLKKHFTNSIQLA